LLLHGLVSLLAGLVSTLLMSPQYRSSPRRVFTLHVLLAFFIPVLGAVAVLVLSAYARVIGRPYQERPYHLVRLPVFTAATKAPSLSYGAGSVHSRLINPEVSGAIRLKALLTVQAMPGNLSTRLLRDVLSDPSDDLRLTAYGILDKGEKEINERIRDALKKLNDPQESDARSELHQQLAGHYWELVYQGYAQGELRRFALRAAWRHAQEAVQADPGSADVWMLAGRIAAAQHDQAAAQHAFQRAQALAMPHSRIRPYLAELAFQKRDFDAVRQHLQGIGRHEINFSTAPLLAFWRQART